jgi:hypothetical protein
MLGSRGRDAASLDSQKGRTIAALELPRPISTYFAAFNAPDIEGMLAPFADHPTVRDEGVERDGRSAIRNWMEETTRKYRATAEPKNVGGTTGRPSVTTVVAGNFPGSPIELTFRFTLEHDQITRLETG